MKASWSIAQTHMQCRRAGLAHRGREAERERRSGTSRLRDRQLESQTDRETDEQTDRQADATAALEATESTQQQAAQDEAATTCAIDTAYIRLAVYVCEYLCVDTAKLPYLKHKSNISVCRMPARRRKHKVKTLQQMQRVTSRGGNARS